jgi:hypothetical protein
MSSGVTALLRLQGLSSRVSTRKHNVKFVGDRTTKMLRASWYAQKIQNYFPQPSRWQAALQKEKLKNVLIRYFICIRTELVL